MWAFGTFLTLTLTRVGTWPQTDLVFWKPQTREFVGVTHLLRCDRTRLSPLLNLNPRTMTELDKTGFRTFEVAKGWVKLDVLPAHAFWLRVEGNAWCQAYGLLL